MNFIPYEKINYESDYSIPEIIDKVSSIREFNIIFKRRIESSEDHKTKFNPNKFVIKSLFSSTRTARNVYSGTIKDIGHKRMINIKARLNNYMIVLNVVWFSFLSIITIAILSLITIAILSSNKKVSDIFDADMFAIFLFLLIFWIGGYCSIIIPFNKETEILKKNFERTINKK